MANKPRKRRGNMAKYVKGALDELIDVGTLAARTLKATITDEVMVAEGRITSIVATYSLSGYTIGTDIGPLLVGVAHSDYSDPEIEAVIENTASWDFADLVQQEVARRKVRIIGQFPMASGGNVGDAQVLNDGKPIKSKLNWLFKAGQGLDFWVYNLGTGAFATTTPDVHIEGHANIFYS